MFTVYCLTSLLIIITLTLSDLDCSLWLWLFHLCWFFLFFYFLFLYNSICTNTAHTHNYQQTHEPSPSWRWIHVSGELFIFQHTQQICPVPISSLSTLTTPAATDALGDWLIEWRAAQRLFFTLKPSGGQEEPSRGSGCRQPQEWAALLMTPCKHKNKPELRCVCYFLQSQHQTSLVWMRCQQTFYLLSLSWVRSLRVTQWKLCLL